MKLPATKGAGVDQIFLGRHVPIRLWALEKCSERDLVESSQGLVWGMELTLKLWELCPEIIYIHILDPSKNIHNI